MKSIKENRGITLITLAVTIVVILILAGVTIDVTLGENGILNKTKEAADRMNNLVKEDEAELNDLLNELNETMDSNWNSNIEIPEGNHEEGGGNIETGGENIGDLVDNGMIEIGDYIAYNPTGDKNYIVNGDYSGTNSDQKINVENLNWRVLDKTEDGKVRLISANPTTSTVTLKGMNGYNNGVYLLDELCNTLYKSEYATSKNLKVEDLQDKMNLSIWDYRDYENYGSTFKPSSKNYPLIFAQELGQTIDGKKGTLDLSEQTSIVTGKAKASSWTVRNTYWFSNELKATNYINPIYYELYHTFDDAYWLSSRCADANSDRVFFYIRDVFKNRTTSDTITYIFDSNNYTDSLKGSIRPVILLDSNVQIDTSVEGKDGKTPETAYIIK